MPELPECESVVRKIRPYVWGCEIIGFLNSSAGKAPDVVPAQVQGQTIRHITRHGKYIIFKLDRGFLVSHLRMTGQWEFTSSDKPGPNSNKYFRWGFTIRGHNGEFSGFLWFKDVRKFGTLVWVESLSDYPPLTTLGPDGLHLDDMKTIFKVILAAEKTRRPIKNFLLDQKVIAGAGNIYSCLDPRCQISMSDGTKKAIPKVEVGEFVLSVNPETLDLEHKRVMGVYPRERRGRALYRVRPVGSQGAVKCTEDHLVFTNKGWVEAKDLRPEKHRVAIPGEKPNYHLEQLILGTSLGDSSIGSSNMGSRNSKCLRLFQGEKQLDYLRYKKNALGSVVAYDPKIMRRKEEYKTENERPVYQVGSLYRPYFYTLWEKSKQRLGITKGLLADLELEGFAYWYMDDGYSAKRIGRKTYANFCCEGRTFEEAALVVVRLAELGYGAKSVPGHGGPVVRLDHESTQRFLFDISQYVHPCIRYKLDGKEKPFNPPDFKWIKTPVFLPFTVEEYKFQIKTVWDLEVEGNHNFIADNVVVHNCEALFAAKVHPAVPAKELTPEKIEEICTHLYSIFKDAIELGGSSLSDHKGGNYHEVLKVYKRDGEPCYQCNTLVVKITQAGRSTFLCPSCQGDEENELS